MRPVLVAIAAVSSLIALTTTQAFAAGPYVSRSTGFDVGWPNCGGSYPTGSYVIAGISHGRPFDVDNGTPNPCLAAEYALSAHHALYLNTGYDPVYYTEHASNTCIQESQALTVDTAHQQAWAVGCSWAESQQGYAQSLGLANPDAWWLDVETANSWSTADLSLNAEALQGGVDRLKELTAGIPVGVYSSGQQWSTIVGNYAVGGLAADWVASGSSNQRRATSFCSRSFSSEPVWLVQWVTSVDRDYAC